LFYNDFVEKAAMKVAQKELDELTAKFETWKSTEKDDTERYWKEVYKRYVFVEFNIASCAKVINSSVACNLALLIGKLAINF
jgi:hypothetical protein